MSTRKRSNGPVIGAVVLGVVAVAAVIAVAVAGGGDDATATPSTADVAVGGEQLPRLEDPATDPALGQQAPSIEGVDFEGAAIDAPVAGQPTVVVFLAHWCPVCQDEVPEVQGWIDAGAQPDDVALVAVSTGVDAARPNYPPAAWFQDEGWTVPTMLDDATSSAGTAYGLPGYPYWVFVTADGQVAGRHAGALGVDDLELIMEQLAEL